MHIIDVIRVSITLLIFVCSRSLASTGDLILGLWGKGVKVRFRDLKVLVGGRKEHCMQKKHVDVEDGLGWIAQYTSRRTPHWDTLSTIFQAFISKVASNLQVRRASG
jgi:hypothetical protein